jgi:hypothetical protein
MERNVLIKDTLVAQGPCRTDEERKERKEKKQEPTSSILRSRRHRGSCRIRRLVSEVDLVPIGHEPFESSAFGHSRLCGHYLSVQMNGVQ